MPTRSCPLCAIRCSSRAQQYKPEAGLFRTPVRLGMRRPLYGTIEPSGRGEAFPFWGAAFDSLRFWVQPVDQTNVSPGKKILTGLLLVILARDEGVGMPEAVLAAERQN